MISAEEERDGGGGGGKAGGDDDDGPETRLNQRGSRDYQHLALLTLDQIATRVSDYPAKPAEASGLGSVICVVCCMLLAAAAAAAAPPPRYSLCCLPRERPVPHQFHHFSPTSPTARPYILDLLNCAIDPGP